jgi:hypothetical protein
MVTNSATAPRDLGKRTSRGPLARAWVKKLLRPYATGRRNWRRTHLGRGSIDTFILAPHGNGARNGPASCPVRTRPKVLTGEYGPAACAKVPTWPLGGSRAWRLRGCGDWPFAGLKYVSYLWQGSSPRLPHQPGWYKKEEYIILAYPFYPSCHVRLPYCCSFCCQHALIFPNDKLSRNVIPEALECSETLLKCISHSFHFKCLTLFFAANRGFRHYAIVDLFEQQKYFLLAKLSLVPGTRLDCVPLSLERINADVFALADEVSGGLDV